MLLARWTSLHQAYEATHPDARTDWWHKARLIRAGEEVGFRGSDLPESERRGLRASGYYTAGADGSIRPRREYP